MKKVIFILIFLLMTIKLFADNEISPSPSELPDIQIIEIDPEDIGFKKPILPDDETPSSSPSDYPEGWGPLEGLEFPVGEWKANVYFCVSDDIDFKSFFDEIFIFRFYSDYTGNYKTYDKEWFVPFL